MMPIGANFACKAQPEPNYSTILVVAMTETRYAYVPRGRIWGS
jgi:hypothetical protein